MPAAATAIQWTEQGLVPDGVIRHAIRGLIRKRIAALDSGDSERMAQRKMEFLRGMNHSAIAPLPHKANQQHYELPAEFFRNVLGAHAKYSCGYWNPGVGELDSAEAQALQITVGHAGIEDGMDILELGCGWGSLTLWMARAFPASRITAISNSRSQQHYIEGRARDEGLDNVRVQVHDMNDYVCLEKFDRIVSVEMFEHMRNYRALFGRISGWLKPGGRFFLHIFCHRDVPYAFEDRNAGDWMSRYFFSGGMMPSDDLPLHFQEHLRLLTHWRWDGRHYEKTANAWLCNMDRRREILWPILEQTYGADFTRQWWMRWRMFFMACAELFGYADGQQWWVSHYLFEKQGAA
jgi:cyclopropane-fatty-acyl-phospholipid synthase